MDFHEIWYLSIFQKSFEKDKFLLKGEKNNGHFTRRPMYTFDDISLSYSDNENSYKVEEKITAHIICSVTFFSNILPFMR